MLYIYWKMVSFNFLEYLNPLRYFTHDEYVSFWQMLFQTVLNGFWARALSVASLILAFWFMARRQNIPMFLFFISMAFITAYLGGLVNMLFKIF